MLRSLLLSLIAGTLLLICSVGCKKSDSSPPSDLANETESVEAAGLPVEYESGAPVEPTGPFEVDPKQLLASALTPEELSEGWVNLFDGQSFFGWFVVGKANWRIEDGHLKVDRGEMSYLCTSFELADYELRVDFRCDANTNSGIFLRTGPEPGNVAEDCLELNIAPQSNPFPTGSLVQRSKVEPKSLGDFDPTQWHTYHVRLVGNTVEVSLDGRQILEFNDASTLPTGHISLQHNQGRVEFRKVMLRPASSKALKLADNWREDWEESVKDGDRLDIDVVADGLKIVGGLGQLQSTASFGNFLLQAEYTLARPEVNSGIFFRCIRDAMLDGYECQVNHATQDGDPLRPGDAGAGAIFRRQAARIVVGDGTTRSYLTLLANGPQFVTWVNGVQVVDFADSREPDENPRRGLRLEPGPISLQGHDPSTEVVFHRIAITDLDSK